MNFEVEQKFRIDDRAGLECHLARLGAAFQGEQLQVDQYFSHPVRDFAATDEALRMRRIGEQTLVAYKGPKVDSTTKTRHEIEVPLAAGAQAAADFARLLEALDFRPAGQVRKCRRVSRVPWMGREVEVALDQVEALGAFVELEVLADAAGLDEARHCLATLADELGLRTSERRSYLELLLGQA